MRMTGLVLAIVLSLSGPPSLRNGRSTVNREDGFKVYFPGQPKATDHHLDVATGITRCRDVSTAPTRARERYSVTVIDYSSLEQQGIERSKACPPGNANCRPERAARGSVPGYWAARRARRHRVRDEQAPATRREADGFEVGMAGHGRRAHHPVDQQRRSVAHLCLICDARTEALYRRGHGAEGVSGAGPVSAVVGLGSARRATACRYQIIYSNS